MGGVQVKEFRPFQKNSLRGFATLLLPSIGLQIKDCTLHESNGKRWVSLPAKPYQKPDGSQAYSYIVSFPDRNVYESFQRQALQAIDAHIAENGNRNP